MKFKKEQKGGLGVGKGGIGGCGGSVGEKSPSPPSCSAVTSSSPSPPASAAPAPALLDTDDAGELSDAGCTPAPPQLPPVLVFGADASAADVKKKDDDVSAYADLDATYLDDQVLDFIDTSSFRNPSFIRTAIFMEVEWERMSPNIEMKKIKENIIDCCDDLTGFFQLP